MDNERVEYISRKDAREVVAKLLPEDACPTAFMMINAIPAADVVERGSETVHAAWIPVPSSDMATGKAYICGNPKCGKMRYGSFQPPFCASCGARMDGDEHD